ncbi:MAG: hypothetical protein AMXMBFR84_12430 [Candidatus Hydrogenedentota bacterium]
MRLLIAARVAVVVAFGLSAHAENVYPSIDLFQAKDLPTGGIAVLLNPDLVRMTPENELATLHIVNDTDPYSKVEWAFRFSRPPFPESEKIVLEIEYFDRGAGVIQPTLLTEDAFRGSYAKPLRGVSYTRLNQQVVRRAWFEFLNPSPSWNENKNPHLKISGLQGLIAIRAYSYVDEAGWKALAASVPISVTPLVQLNRPMAITCTVGIPDEGDPPPLETALDNIREYAPLAKLLGFTSVECFVRWNLIELQPGAFDFSHYDTIVEAIRQRGLKWFPNLVITSAFALPEWYVSSNENVGFQCLEHGDTNQVPSIWNAANLTHVERVLHKFGQHYEPMGVLEAVRLGPSGNFGEAQYPAGAGGGLGIRGERMHAHIGWWAGDAYAAQDFRSYLRHRYGAIEALNAAWSETHPSFEAVQPALPESYRTRQGRLDMTAWYTDSMSKWCDAWAHIARKSMPVTPIYMSSGGWGFREAGTDFSAQAETMKSVNGGIRLTNETDSFEQNVYATRLAATAARLYGIELGYEPAGYHSARGTVARFFSTLTTNGDNLYTRHSVLFEHPYSVDNWLRDYRLLDLRADPIVDVAVYYPETMNQLDDSTFRHLYAWGFNTRVAEVRRRVDVDYLDERLIRKGFLDRYKVLVFCWGNVIEHDVQQVIDQWIRSGGVAIYPTYPRVPQETIEGEQKTFLAWEKGDTGKGTFHRFRGDMEPISLYGDFIDRCIREVDGLHALTKEILALDLPERVFACGLEDGTIVVLNYSESTISLETAVGRVETLEPYSIKVLRTGQ